MIKTRFAPSPTGFLHIGGLRTALFAYLLAKKEGGNFVLRIEDTDRERLVEGATENILHALAWGGIGPDEGVVLDNNLVSEKGDCGPYIQSQRTEIYREHVQKLLESGAAYYAFDTAEEIDEMRKRQQLNKQPTRYERETMTNVFTLGEEETQKRIDAGDKYVIRLKMPHDRALEINDLVRGKVSIHGKEVDDQVLMKSDGFPTYHLAVVVDDHHMGITHVIRGEEWLSSTPKHVLLYEAFGWEAPIYAHLPLLVNEKKQKLSKRHGDVSVEDFKEKGYLAEAMINFIAFLGWNPGDEREIFSLAELEAAFSFEGVGKSAAVFNRERLDWMNKQYMMNMDLSELTKRTVPFYKNAGILGSDEIDDQEEFERLKKVVDTERSRSATLSELVANTGFFFADTLEYDAELLIWKKATREESQKVLSDLVILMNNISDQDWNKDKLEEIVRAWIGEQGLGNGDVLWPLRTSLSGLKNSPSPFEIAGAIGKQVSIARVSAGAAALSS